MIHTLFDESIALLQQLIATPSFSKEEAQTAAIIEKHLNGKGIKTERLLHNVWAFNKHFDASKPTILLNSHHDTVRPNGDYTKDPFTPEIADGKLYGLGSNDAGGCLVSLIAAFVFFYEQTDLKYNLCLAATAEEEISGHDGLERILPLLGKLDFAIVGEPTQLQLAIAERGLMVLDCRAHGKSGHAARGEGENAIYKALADIHWFNSYQFARVSELFGAVKMSVTMIQAGSQHNVVPSVCDFVVDVRVTEVYTNEELLELIQHFVSSEVKVRSTRLKPSSIDVNHPIVQAGIALGKTKYGSPTTSDQALLRIPSLKMGPGDSARSHTADEFIYLEEIQGGIADYINIIQQIV
ncbi:M20 family metallo-hydrolase [Flavobacterium sp. JP2137]|uniref:M20 family metallo-hydrolase n=1 Tax=Flavobacterium sp. JP2137 TaxID=3414510 RepID=UPI003D2FE063